MKCAINRDITKRYSAEQLLEHKWIKQSVKVEKITNEEQAEIFKNLRNFSNTSKF